LRAVPAFLFALFVGVPGALGCDIGALRALLPGAAGDSFVARAARLNRRLTRLATSLQGGAGDAAWRAQQATSVQGEWAEVYLAHALQAPPGVSPEESWRDRVDGLAGPLDRLRRLSAEDPAAAHVQAQAAQAVLAELFGEFPTRAVELGPLAQGLAVLAAIPDEARNTPERAARLRLLEGRRLRWEELLPARTRSLGEVRSFLAGLRELPEAYAAGEPGGARARLRELLEAIARVEAVALRASLTDPSSQDPTREDSP